MNLPTTLRALVPAVALVLPLSLSLTVAGPASAASWTKVLSVDGAQSQACKVSVRDGRAWRIRVRMVGGRSGQVRSTYSVTGSNGRVVQRATLVSAGVGKTSSVKSVVIRRDGSQRLGAGMSTAQGGLGDSDVLRGVGRC